MGTAIVVAIVSGLVSLVSVLTNAYITRVNIRAESKRATEAREAEDKRALDAREAEDRRLREDRDAEAQRRENDRVANQQADLARANAEQVAARWAAVREVIEAEANLVNDPVMWVSRYRLLLQALSLLTHTDEANLRAALRVRANMAGNPYELVTTQVRPEWWHPWVSAWAANPHEAMIYGLADEGKVF